MSVGTIKLVRYFFVYITGLVLLLTAIVVNYIAETYGLATWYDVLVGGQRVGLIDAFWLAVIYPSILGVTATGFNKYWNKIRRKYKADKKE